MWSTISFKRIFTLACVLTLVQAQSQVQTPTQSDPSTPDHSYTLLHRFIPHPNPSFSPPEWATHGSIDINHEGAGPVGVFVKGDGREPQTDDGRGWYQLGLVVGDQTLITSVKSCHTAAPLLYRFILSLSTNTPDAIPTALHLDLGMFGVSPDGECPKRWFEEGDRLFLPKGINTEVVLKVPERAKRINLNPAPPVDATTGKPAEPVVEKSFLQKYWLPLLGIGFFVVSQMAPEPPKQGAGGAGGGAK